MDRAACPCPATDKTPGQDSTLRWGMGETDVQRSMLWLLAVLALVGIPVRAQRAPVALSSAGAAWPQFRGNARLTGVATSAPPEKLSLLWTYDVGESIDSSAAIVDGVVYAGSASGDLVALDLASGKLRWKYATGSSIGESSPAVANGTVVVGDNGGTVHGVNAGDGSRVWTFKTGSEVKSSPTIVDTFVLIGSYDGNLYALDLPTGRLRWKLETGGPVHATPAVQDRIVYIAGCDEAFRAVRLADGKELFNMPEGANTAASPVVAGDRAYIGTFGNEVLGFDLRARKLLWRYQDPDRQFPYYSSAALIDGRLIVGGRDKTIHAIDTRTGKSLWKFVTGARVDSSPVVAGGRVYVGSSDGRLYVTDVATGRKLWEFDTGAAIVASPTIAEGRVVIGSSDGRLYCFG